MKHYNIVDEHFREQIDGLLVAQVLIVFRDEFHPMLLRVAVVHARARTNQSNKGINQSVQSPFCFDSEMIKDFPFLLSENLGVARIQSQIVLLNISVQFFSSEHLRDLYQLILVVRALEEGFLLEDL